MTNETQQVPVTDKMLEAGQAECPADATLSHASLRAVFEAMIAAAPATEPSEVERLSVLQTVFDILESAPELNPSNYDHEQVCDLNAKAVEAYMVIKNSGLLEHHPDHPEWVRVKG